MPQIWMTYSEVADLLGCTAEQAYERIRAEGLDRKISRDGRKRVKLNLVLAGIFIDRLRAPQDRIDQAVDDLRHMHRLMQGYEPQLDLFDKVATDKESAVA